MLPKLSVRGACVEDYDDLMPVFNNQSDVLSATYGDFFLAHIIEVRHYFFVTHASGFCGGNLWLLRRGSQADSALEADMLHCLP